MKSLTLILAFMVIALLSVGCNDATITNEPQALTEDNFVPFNGSCEGVAITTGYSYPVPKLLTVSGNATHTGKFDAVANYFVTFNGNPPTGGTLIDGDGCITAANGDKIYLDGIEGLWYFTSPTDVYFSFGAVITGGTGRFTGATGQFSGEGTQIFDPYNDPTPTFYSWNGTINY